MTHLLHQLRERLYRSHRRRTAKSNAIANARHLREQGIGAATTRRWP